MELKINKMTLKNFKGVQHKVVELNGKSARLCAQNGGFKTTTADAWYHVMANCNTAMVNNPDVVPIGADEVKPTVEIEMTIDDKIVTVKKVQTFKKKENTSSISNTYYINEVEKSYKDFVADLTERGVDMKNILMFSHPNAFMADTSKKGREEMRSILFKMCEDVSDEQIASEMSGIEELKALLENYSLDECEQINKATLKKINEEAGKDNSLYRARIEELIGQKSTLDKKVLTEQKKSYEEEIERIEKKLTDLSSGKADVSKKIADLKIQRDKVAADANKELNDKKVEVDKEYRKIQLSLDEHNWQLKQVQLEKAKLESKLNELNEDLKKQRTLYKTEQGAMLDDSDRYCPTCHREFEADKLKKIKAEFEKNKAERLKTIKASGESIKASIAEVEKEISEVEIKINNYEKLVEESQMAFDAAQMIIDALPQSVDLSMNKDYVKLSEQITKLESELSTDDDALIEELNSQKNVNKQMLNQVNGELAVLEKNVEIDKRIAEIRQAQKDAEIRRADAEKVLDQVDRFKRFKNDKLTENINSKFSLVKWKLYDFQRNGEIKDVCIPLIDNKPMDNCCNGSLITLCKISICADLQRNFQQFVPIWVEDYSLFSSNTESRLNADSQIIGLVVTEDDELKVEGE